MPKRTDSKPPDHLGVAGRKFWRDIQRDYELEPHDSRRLEIACDCLDRIAQARVILAKSFDRNAMNSWRDASKIFLATIKHLGVDKCSSAKHQ
jgi:hypothetical protein